MTNEDDAFHDEILTAEDPVLVSKLREAERHIRELEAQGWRWDIDDRIRRVLCHPGDPEINIWFDPYSSEELLSPKLVEQLRKDVERENEMRKDI